MSGPKTPTRSTVKPGNATEPDKPATTGEFFSSLLEDDGMSGHAIASGPPALIVEDIHKSFGAHEVLKGVSLSAVFAPCLSPGARRAPSRLSAGLPRAC